MATVKGSTAGVPQAHLHTAAPATYSSSGHGCCTSNDKRASQLRGLLASFRVACYNPTSLDKVSHGCLAAP